MNAQQYQELITKLTHERWNLTKKKGQDYATEDVLSNFKRVNIMCQQLDIDPRRSPREAALFLAVLKLDRWQSLRSQGKTPQNESVEDTVMDLLNYIELAYALDTKARVPEHVIIHFD